MTKEAKERMAKEQNNSQPNNINEEAKTKRILRRPGEPDHTQSQTDLINKSPNKRDEKNGYNLSWGNADKQLSSIAMKKQETLPSTLPSHIKLINNSEPKSVQETPLK